MSSAERPYAKPLPTHRLMWTCLAIGALATTLLPAAAVAQEISRQRTLNLTWNKRAARSADTLARIKGIDGDRPIKKNGPIRGGDTLSAPYPWVVRLQLKRTSTRTGRMSFAAQASGDDPLVVFGPEAGDLPAQVIVEENSRGRSRARLLRGAIFSLDKWPVNRTSCAVETPGACTVPFGTGYTVVVGEGGDTQLAVTSDTVQIRWWGRDTLVQRIAVGPDASDSMFVAANGIIVEATEEEPYWWWTEDQEPTQGVPRRTLLPPFVLPGEALTPLPLLSDVGDIIDFNFDDVWSAPIYKKWWFWTPPAAVGLCLLTKFWICGGDVSGNVIINPSR